MRIKEIEVNEEGLYFYPKELKDEIIKPSFKASKKVQLLVGYFSIDSFLPIIEGLEVFFNNEGIVRVNIGVPRSGLDPHNKKLVEALRLAESNDEVVKAYTDEIIYQAGRLENELRKDRIRTFAYLIKKGSVQVKFSILKDAHVHTKIFIFEDEEDGLAVSGAANFSVNAFESDHNNMHVFQSYEDEKTAKQFKKLKNKVERYWNNEEEGVDVIEGTYELANELLKAVGEKSIEKIITSLSSVLEVENLYNSILKSPIWLEYTLSKSALWPHQIGTVQEALQKWPIKNLFADEVGLGKTLEVGATLKYLHTHKNIKKVLILCPASVTTQWQDEMKKHFGMNFFVYDNKERAFVDCNEDLHFVNNIKKYDNSFPDLSIMGKERAAGKFGNHLFKESNEFPELLILDEAHHARAQIKNNVYSQTLLRELIQSIQDKVTHILFASATPLRKDVMEYYFLLQLLGIESWLSQKQYKKTLLELGKESNKIDPLIISTIFGILQKTISTLVKPPVELTEEESYVFHQVCSGKLKKETLLNYLNYQEAIISLSVKLYPTSLFTSRNYRATLSKFPSYKFPKRNLEPSPIDEQQVSDDLQNFQYGLEEYANGKYLSTEIGFGTISRSALGKAAFKEAFVSSFFAAKQKLLNRREKIQGYLEDAKNHKSNNFNPENIIDSDDEESEEIDIGFNASKDTPDWDLIHDKGQSELLEVNALLELAENIEENCNDKNPDPKLLNLLEIIQKHFEKTDKPILVFARYLSTIDAAVKFIDSELGENLEGIGIYKGGGDISVKFKSLPNYQKKTKDNVKEYLNKGMIDILFCTTAAQEGVNLQAASAMVNIDVPWIPSDLEQRIGRIARLGQEADEVTIFNLWYPNSYEGKIYKKLLERKDLLELALGEFPEIVAEAIKAESLQHNTLDNSGGMIKTLTKAKLDISYVAISKLWNSSKSDTSPRADEFRKNLKELYTYLDIDSSKYTVSPGKDNSISFRNIEFIEKIKHLEFKTDKNTAVFEIYGRDDGKIYGFMTAPVGPQESYDITRLIQNPEIGLNVPAKRKFINPYSLPTLLKGLISDDEVKIQFLQSRELSSSKMHYVYQFLRTYKYYFPEWLLPQHYILNNNLKKFEIENLQSSENNDLLLKKPWTMNLQGTNSDDQMVSYRFIGTINF